MQLDNQSGNILWQWIFFILFIGIGVIRFQTAFSVPLEPARVEQERSPLRPSIREIEADLPSDIFSSRAMGIKQASSGPAASRY